MASDPEIPKNYDFKKSPIRHKTQTQYCHTAEFRLTIWVHELCICIWQGNWTDVAAADFIVEIGDGGLFLDSKLSGHLLAQLGVEKIKSLVTRHCLFTDYLQHVNASDLQNFFKNLTSSIVDMKWMKKNERLLWWTSGLPAFLVSSARPGVFLLQIVPSNVWEYLDPIRCTKRQLKTNRTLL